MTSLTDPVNENNTELKLVEEANSYSNSQEENNLIMYAKNYNKISNMLSNNNHEEINNYNNKSCQIEEVNESCSDSYQNNENYSELSETETYSNDNNKNISIENNSNTVNDSSNIINTNNNEIIGENFNFNTNPISNMNFTQNDLYENNMKMNITMNNECVNKEGLQIQILENLSNLNNINQLNQFNQINPLNQYSNMSQINQINQLNQINQIHLNQLNQYNAMNQNPYVQQQLLNSQMNPMNYYQINNIGNLGNLGNMNNLSSIQAIQNLSNVNMNMNMNMNLNNVNPNILPFLSPMEQNFLINGCSNPYVHNNLQNNIKNLINMQKQILATTQMPIPLNPLNPITPINTINYNNQQQQFQNNLLLNDIGSSNLVTDTSIVEKQVSINNNSNNTNTIPQFNQISSMQLNQINIGNLNNLNNINNISNLNNINNLNNVQSTSNTSQITNLTYNKLSTNTFKRKKNARFFEANNKYKVEEFLKNIHKFEINKYTSSKIEINSSIFMSKDHLTKVNMIAQKRNNLQNKLMSLISKTNFETILKINPETKQGFNFKMASNEIYNSSKIKISVKFIKRYLNTFSLESMINKLINLTINPPTFPNPDKILFYGYNQKLRIVLDLDHTLVFAEMEKTISNNFKYFKQVNSPNERINNLNLNNTHFINLVYDQENKTEYLTFRTRTYLEEFLDRLSLIGNIYVNTQGIKEYADKVVEIINKRYKKFKESIWNKEDSNDINIGLINESKIKLEMKKVQNAYNTLNSDTNKNIFSKNFKDKSEYTNIEDNLITEDRVISCSSTDVNRSKNQVKNLNYEDHINNPEHFEHNVIILDDFVNKWEPKYQNVCLSSMQFHGFNNSDMFDNNEIKFIESIKKAYNYKVNGTHHNIDLFNKNLVDSNGSPFCLESDMSKTFQLENLSEFILDIFKLSRLTGCTTQYCIAYLKKSILFGCNIDIKDFSEDTKVYSLLKDMIIELGGTIVSKDYSESEENPIYFIVKNTFSILKPNKKNHFLSSGWLIHCFFYAKKQNISDYIIVN